MATKEQVKSFLNTVPTMVQIVVYNRIQLGKDWSLPSVAIAQAACESNWGTSTKMVKANALFGIKVGKSKVHFGNAWDGSAYDTKTKECYDGSSYVTINDFFRAYRTIEDSIQDYFDMLASCKRYKNCLNKRDPRETIQAIKDGGYATSPTYVSTIMSIINTYNLTKYDSIIPGLGMSRNLKMWTLGKDVEELQKLLSQLGYYSGEIDGIFGKRTCLAVESFQRDNNLKVDGIVGVQTRAMLHSLI